MRHCIGWRGCWQRVKTLPLLRGGWWFWQVKISDLPIPMRYYLPIPPCEACRASVCLKRGLFWGKWWCIWRPRRSPILVIRPSIKQCDWLKMTNRLYRYICVMASPSWCAPKVMAPIISIRMTTPTITTHSSIYPIICWARGCLTLLIMPKNSKPMPLYSG